MVKSTNISDEQTLIQHFFYNTRDLLDDYFSERQLTLSNSQLFAFVLISPITLAIASDGNLDMTETTMLVDIASYFDRGVLSTEFDQFEQPAYPMTDKEFKKIVYSELRYLCLNMPRYQNSLMACLKKLIQLDEKISQDLSPQFSIRNRAKEMMYGVIYNNLGVDSDEESRLQEIFSELELN